eukprot:6467586-Pyramimonas_sp.AAC.1
MKFERGHGERSDGSSSECTPPKVMRFSSFLPMGGLQTADFRETAPVSWAALPRLSIPAVMRSPTI